MDLVPDEFAWGCGLLVVLLLALLVFIGIMIGRAI